MSRVKCVKINPFKHGAVLSFTLNKEYECEIVDDNKISIIDDLGVEWCRNEINGRIYEFMLI